VTTMTTLSVPGRAAVARVDLAVVDVVIPVYNEERDLERCVRRLHRHLSAEFPYPFRITIADNASTDATPRIARVLAAGLDRVRVRRLAGKGRGLALRTAWSESDAPVLAYMDVDLSTDLAALLPLVAPLISGHSDVAIGTRLARGSRVVRGLKREALSRGYNLLLRGALSARFSDAQCGFKAIRKDVADSLLPMVVDTGWFFDTELLVLAQRTGLRIHEVPVDWIDDPESRVEIVPTVLADLRGIVRLGRALVGGTLPLTDARRRLARRPLAGGAASDRGLPAGAAPGRGLPAGLVRQLARFAAIGVVSTVAYLALFALLRTGLDAQVANVVALMVTAVANTAANRRLTFGIVGRHHAGRHHLQGLFVFGLGLGLTSGALAALDALAAAPARWIELAVVTAANLAATVLRFVLLRLWFHHRRPDVDRVGASTLNA
jgi:putative flippase GtrA